MAMGMYGIFGTKANKEAGIIDPRVARTEAGGYQGISDKDLELLAEKHGYTIGPESKGSTRQAIPSGMTQVARSRVGQTTDPGLSDYRP